LVDFYGGEVSLSDPVKQFRIRQIAVAVGGVIERLQDLGHLFQTFRMTDPENKELARGNFDKIKGIIQGRLQRAAVFAEGRLIRKKVAHRRGRFGSARSTLFV
jgi:hypothetical protein